MLIFGCIGVNIRKSSRADDKINQQHYLRKRFSKIVVDIVSTECYSNIVAAEAIKKIE